MWMLLHTRCLYCTLSPAALPPDNTCSTPKQPHKCSTVEGQFIVHAGKWRFMPSSSRNSLTCTCI
jgi:hypothetical protein